jgi:glycosyltransferase involved in cell wall biosynthesis
MAYLAPDEARRPPIRVLYVDNSFTYGGAIISLSHLVRSLAPRHVDPLVISGQPEDQLQKLFPAGTTESWKLELAWIVGDPIVGLPTLEKMAHLGLTKRLVRNLYLVLGRNLPSAWKLARAGRGHHVDLVHLNNSAQSQLDGLLAAKLLNVPCVSHAREISMDTGPGARLNARLASHHIAISNAVAARLAGVGVPRERVTVIYNGIDSSRFCPAPSDGRIRAELGIAASTIAFVHVGRMVPWKGQLEFVEAFARACAEVPDIHALMVGDASDGPVEYGETVRSRARELGVAEKVTFFGYRQDVPEVIRSCDVLVHSSIEPEPFGRVIIEGMACARPVVAANRGGPLETVRDGVDGFLVDPLNIEQFAHGLVALARSGALRARMGSAATLRARQDFSVEASAARVLDVYEKVLAKSGRWAGPGT